jgi:hypothetical protein
LEVELFTRTTRTSKTPEGLQQSNISIFVYDNLDIAYTYFRDFMSDEEWEKQIETGEGFYEVEGNGYTNTIFLETRKIQINPKL